MKKIVLLLLFVGSVFLSYAAYLEKVPVTLVQPNGDTLRCFATGAEFYHRLHAAQGYTIVKNPETGYFVYAQHDAAGELVPSSLVAGGNTPKAALDTKGIRPHLMPSDRELVRLHKAWDIPEECQAAAAPKSGTTNRGTINNLVIFIRFSDDSGISTPFSTINSMFNDSSANGNSMLNYFRNASYGQLTLRSHFYPAPNGNTVVSYQDSYPRSHYEPYDAVSNPNGYTDRQVTKFGLLERCINWVNSHCNIPSSLNLDYDNDGNIDNITFIIKGVPSGWSDLLWPQRSALYDRYVYINGKRVYNFNLQLEGAGSALFNTGTLCHEMFHTLGAPDLYHYYNYTAVHPVGYWDLMGVDLDPPQHPSAFMKAIYGNWIDNIPMIALPGTYTLYSLADQTIPAGATRCYTIPSPDPDQCYILEYRDDMERFETSLPWGGLLVWRVDFNYSGCAQFDGSTVLDGIYVFRPGTISDTTSGLLVEAPMGAHRGMPTFTPLTDPFPFLNHNQRDTTF